MTTKENGKLKESRERALKDVKDYKRNRAGYLFSMICAGLAVLCFVRIPPLFYAASVFLGFVANKAISLENKSNKAKRWLKANA